MKSDVLAVMLVAVLCLFVNVESYKIDYEDCGSTGVVVNNVDVSPCSTNPCEVFPGKQSSIAVSFTTKSPAANLTATAYGSIAGIKVRYPLPQSDACQKCNLTCPLKAQENDVYNLTLPIPKGIPKVIVIVELDLVVKDQKYLCIDFPLQVTPTGKFFGKDQEGFVDLL